VAARAASFKLGWHLFKGGDYSRKAIIQGNTVSVFSVP
jgi:hypothetical protein